LKKQLPSIIDHHSEKVNNSPKGKLCSKSGGEYEKIIHHIVLRLKLRDHDFNTQGVDQLGGSKNTIDLQCNYLTEKDIGIEIKKHNTPDWMQCSLKYDNQKHMWYGSEKGKIPEKARELFNQLINTLDLYENEIPPFFSKKIVRNSAVRLFRFVVAAGLHNGRYHIPRPWRGHQSQSPFGRGKDPAGSEGLLHRACL